MAIDNEVVRTIFHQVLEKEETNRQSLITKLCGEDKELRQEVEQLVNAYDSSESILEYPFGDNSIDLAGPVFSSGDRVGNYQITKLLGDGGFGEVYQARQLEPIQRTVAIKFIKPGMCSAEVLARFEAERQTLAVLEHPSIACLLYTSPSPRDRQKSRMPSSA